MFSQCQLQQTRAHQLCNLKANSEQEASNRQNPSIKPLSHKRPLQQDQQHLRHHCNQPHSRSHHRSHMTATTAIATPSIPLQRSPNPSLLRHAPHFTGLVQPNTAMPVSHYSKVACPGWGVFMTREAMYISFIDTPQPLSQQCLRRSHLLRQARPVTPQLLLQLRKLAHAGICTLTHPTAASTRSPSRKQSA